MICRVWMAPALGDRAVIWSWEELPDGSFMYAESTPMAYSAVARRGGCVGEVRTCADCLLPVALPPVDKDTRGPVPSTGE